MQNNKIKLAVVGSRSINDKNKIFQVLDKNKDKIELIISGGAEGPDEISREYCKEKGIPCLIYYPKWYDDNGEYNKGAGFIRNKKIIESSDAVLAFWDMESRGTANSIDWAKKLNKKLLIVECENPLRNYTIFAASSSWFSPYHKHEFVDPSKNIKFETIYQGYCWYFAKFINNQNLENSALSSNYEKTFDGLISEKLLGADKWVEWKNIESKIIKYLIKLKGRDSARFRNEVLHTNNTRIIYASIDSVLGCGLKKCEININNINGGENLIGKAIEEYRNSLNEQK